MSVVRYLYRWTAVVDGCGRAWAWVDGRGHGTKLQVSIDRGRLRGLQRCNGERLRWRSSLTNRRLQWLRIELRGALALLSCRRRNRHLLLLLFHRHHIIHLCMRIHWTHAVHHGSSLSRRMGERVHARKRRRRLLIWTSRRHRNRGAMEAHTHIRTRTHERHWWHHRHHGRVLEGRRQMDVVASLSRNSRRWKSTIHLRSSLKRWPDHWVLLRFRRTRTW